MWTVIGTLIFGCFGFSLGLPNNGTSPARPRARPQARMQMTDLIAPSGTSGNRPTCIHDGRWYYERSVIPTVDSCINCKCENGMVRCNMTLCPMYPNVQDGCQLAHEEGSCCPQLVCSENVAKKMSNVPEIHDATLLGCTYNDFEFGLGDFIPTSDPCQACYCIHNRTQCVHQNCALPESAREGCRPVYHHGICCPIRYDCAEAMAVPPTQRPQFTSEGCAVNNKLYDEGEAISSGRPCEHCYCMKGEMICAMQKCDTPMAGCVPVIKDGQCCPERFECPNIETTPAPWNNTGAVFADPASSATVTKRKLNLNITIETKFPHQQPAQQQQRFSSTTRALEDDNDLLGDLQHTTSPTVTSTTVQPVQLVKEGQNGMVSLTGLPQVGLPTVQPTAAQIGFLSLNGHRTYGQLTMRVNGSQQYPNNNNRRLPPRAPGLSSPWLPAANNSQTASLGANQDVLQYSIPGQDKTAPVASSEILNSGIPLGTRSPDLNSTSTPASTNSQTVMDSIDRLITHVVGGSTSLSMGSSSDIPLDSKLNVTSVSSVRVRGPVAVSVNGSTVPLATGSTLIASASGNSSVRAVLLPPLDPSSSDPLEGFIRTPVRPINRNTSSLVPLDPDNSSEIEGAASVSNPDQKVVVQVPFAHLTEFGLAVDPSANDQLEGQLNIRHGIKTGNSSASLPQLRPLDPANASEVEGWLKTARNTAAPSNVKVAMGSSLLPMDPQSSSEIEGALSIASPSEKVSISSSNRPLDPDSASQIEGAIALTNVVRTNGSSASENTRPPIDPTHSSDVKDVLNVKPATTVMAVITPVDPTRPSDVEGALVLAIGTNSSFASQTTRATAAAAAAGPSVPVVNAVIVPLDPTQPSDVEGALMVDSGAKSSFAFRPTRPAPTTVLAPLDPTRPSEVEGALNVSPASSQSPISSGSSQTVLGLPVDPTKSADVEGALSTVRAIRPAPSGSLNPTGPVPSDQFEGAVVIKSTVQQIPVPVNLTVPVVKNRLANKTIVLSPLDPSAGAEVEGVLHWSNPVRKVAAGVLHPTDPLSEDNFEGILPINSSVSASGVASVPPANYTAVDKMVLKPAAAERPQPIEPSLSDNIEGVWDTVRRATSEASITTTTLIPLNSTRWQDSAVVVLNQTASSQPQRPLVAVMISTKQTFNLSSNGGGAAVTADKSNTSAIPTTAPVSLGTALLSVNLNGSIPANLMMALGNIKAGPPSSWDMTSPVPLNFMSTNLTDSKIITLPADPESSDDFEGQLNGAGQSKLPNLVLLPADPVPTDEYEGASEQPNEVRVVMTATTRPPWTIYTNQNNDSTVSRWVIRTQNGQPAGLNGRNITWVPGGPMGSTMGGTDLPMVVYVSSTTTSAPTTSTTTVTTSTSTTGLPPRPTTTTPTSTPTSSSTTTTTSSPVPSSSTSTSTVTSTDEPIEGISDVQSVLHPDNLDKLPSMVIKENRRVTSTPASIDTTANQDTTSAPMWAGLFRPLAVSNNEGSIPVSPAFDSGAPLTGIYENGCFYDGTYYRNYQSVPTGDLVDPCMVRLCKDGVILGPSEQRCPPPIEGCFSTSIPGVCCPVYLCPNYLERNETSYTLTAASGDTLNTEKTKLALAKFCRVGPRFLALNERVVHVMGVQCQTCTCKPKGIVCEPGCAQGILITTEMPPVIAPRRFSTLATTPATTLPSTLPPVTEPAGARSCIIQKKRFLNGDEVSFNDPCHICTCMDGLVICKINRKGCRSAKILDESELY